MSRNPTGADCEKLTAYLDRRLAAEQELAFEQHVQDCPSCHRELSINARISQRVRDWVQAQPDPLPTAQLLARVEKEKTSRLGLWSFVCGHGLQPGGATWRRWAVAVPIGALAIAAAVFLWPSVRAPQHPLSQEFSIVLGKRDHSSEPGILLTGASRVLARVGQSTVGVAPESRVRLAANDTFHVERGAAAFDIPQNQQSGVRLPSTTIVHIQHTRIMVRGTRFAVEHTTDGARVILTRGKLTVETPQETFDLESGFGVTVSKAGDVRFSLTQEDEEKVNAWLSQKKDNAPLPVDKPKSPSERSSQLKERPPRSPAKSVAVGPTQWRAWILEGKLLQAKTSLAQHLGKRPKDAEAWQLLAEAARRLGDLQLAETAMRKVIDSGNQTQAGRARYRLGTMLAQRGAHREAVKVLQAYLQHPSPALEANARLRLARSLIQTGDKTPARKQLELLLRNFPATQAAAEGRKLLKSL